MENKERVDYVPGQWSAEAAARKRAEKQPGRGCPISLLIAIVCFVAAVSILFTHTLTVNSQRKHYTPILQAQQEVIDRLEAMEDGDAGKLEMLSMIFQTYGYYAGKVSEKELMDEVLRAYVKATDDHYAEYLTEEEYLARRNENNGDYEGIGVSVIQTELTVDGIAYPVFQIIAIYENAPAAASTLRVGDFIYAVKNESGYQTITALGGFDAALNMIRGKAGTQAEFAAFRKNGSSGYESLTFSITRGAYESQSVRFYTKENDPTVGVIHVTGFDMTTPHQFKEAVRALQAGGAKHFVFDLRNNPGGDLQSIKAVLTYFLKEGDLILSSIDRKGNVARSYVAEAMTLTGDYEPCSVSAEEIGMFADLDMVVLCNGNTASAAEVFVATLRDYGLAKIVGETTFGKGIMQTTGRLSQFDKNLSGYLKMTTYAYVTKCGVTYHDIGIAPDVGLSVSLSDEAKQYNIYVLPQELDDQLQMAFAQFQ